MNIHDVDFEALISYIKYVIDENDRVEVYDLMSKYFYEDPSYSNKNMNKIIEMVTELDCSIKRSIDISTGFNYFCKNIKYKPRFKNET